jgi:hypothetical protein
MESGAPANRDTRSLNFRPIISDSRPLYRSCLGNAPNDPGHSDFLTHPKKQHTATDRSIAFKSFGFFEAEKWT